MENKYYLYRHIRLDKNEVFYVGIGKKKNRKYRSITSEYYRAYAFYKSERNKHWFNIYNKTDIKVEILLESDNKDFIKQKEIEFIALYGREDLGLGTLVNFTNGAEGMSERIISEETKQKMRDNSGIKGRVGKLCHFSKSVYVYTLDGRFIGQWDSLNEACITLNILSSAASHQINGRYKQCAGYRFFYEYQGKTITPLLSYGSGSNKIKKVHQIKDNMIIKTFDSLIEASLQTGTTYANISRACITGIKANKFNWSYVD